MTAGNRQQILTSKRGDIVSDSPQTEYSEVRENTLSATQPVDAQIAGFLFDYIKLKPTTADASMEDAAAEEADEDDKEAKRKALEEQLKALG